MITAAVVITLCVLPIASWGQPYITPVATQQQSAANPAAFPGSCDPDALSSHLTSVIGNLSASLSSNGGALDAVNAVLRGRNMSNPANSCAEIYNLAPSNSPSGYYWLMNQMDGTTVSTYCDMQLTCGCSNQRGWTRVALFDMGDASTNCPSQWRLLQSGGERACGKTTSGWGWNARSHSVQGVPYQRVCGKIIGYLYGSPDTYDSWNGQKWRTVNDVYFDGVDVVYGHYNPNTNANNYNHVWSNAASYWDGSGRCPCMTNTPQGYTVPTFVGVNQFCEGGKPTGGWSASLKPQDPLWDGMSCTATEGPCCGLQAGGNTPPWFCRNISTTTTENLVIRLMSNQPWHDEDITVHSYELYVQ